MPRKVPMISGRGVSSRRCIPAGIYGRKFARNGLSGLNPIRSGNSCAAAASLALMLSLDISVTSDQFWQSGELVKGKDRGTLHAANARGQAEPLECAGRAKRRRRFGFQVILKATST